MDIDAILRLCCVNAYELYKATLRGDRPPDLDRLSRLMHEIHVGVVVMEITTIHAPEHDRQRIGVLTQIVQEPIPHDPDWNIEVDGPLPTEPVYYLQTIDGPCRWRNATVIRVVDAILPWALL